MHKLGGIIMSEIAQVVRLDHKNEVYKAILAFLVDKGKESNNTRDAYERDLKHFFMYTRGKKLEDLNEKDLIFKKSDIIYYQTYLSKELGYSNTTVNRKINTIRSLYTFLKSEEFDVKPEVLSINDLEEDSKPIGFLEVDEVYAMMELLGDSRRDKEMKAYLTVSLQTSLRKSAILKLHEKQILKNEKDEFIIMTIDKGKQQFKEIDEETYELLMELKNEDGTFFTIPQRTLEYRFHRLCEKIGIDPRRNVKPHSLKKAGVNYVKEATNDLQAAQEQAGHSSPEITAKWYTKKPKNVLSKLLKIRNEEYKDIFKKLTHEECIQLLESFTNGIEYQLKMKAKKIIDSRKENKSE